MKDKVSGETTGASRKEIEMMVREEFEESQRRDERKLNIMCFGLEESSSLNIELKKKEDETTVTSIFQEVMGEEEDFSECKMVRIGRPIQPVESQDNEVVTLGEATLVGLETRKKIRPVRITLSDADKKKRALAALRETINESRSDKYKYIFFQQDLTLKQREIPFRAAASEAEKVQRVLRAQHGSRDSLFHKR